MITELEVLDVLRGKGAGGATPQQVFAEIAQKRGWGKLRRLFRSDYAIYRILEDLEPYGIVRSEVAFGAEASAIKYFLTAMGAAYLDKLKARA